MDYLKIWWSLSYLKIQARFLEIELLVAPSFDWVEFSSNIPNLVLLRLILLLSYACVDLTCSFYSSRLEAGMLCSFCYSGFLRAN